MSQSGGNEKPSSVKTGSAELARLIRERRERLGLSRQDLADATGIPYPTIAQIETAYRGVSPARLGVIARALGLDPKELYEVLASDAEEGGAAEPLRAPASTPTPTPSRPESRRAAHPVSPAPGAPPPLASGVPVRDRAAAPAEHAGWFGNPGYARDAPTGSPARSELLRRLTARVDAAAIESAQVVDQVVDLLSQLPAEQRLEAFSQVQRRLLARLVDERVQDATDD